MEALIIVVSIVFPILVTGVAWNLALKYRKEHTAKLSEKDNLIGILKEVIETKKKTIETQKQIIERL